MRHIRIDSHLFASQSSIQCKRAVHLTKMAEHGSPWRKTARALTWFDLELFPSFDLGACEAMKAMKAMKASGVIFPLLLHSCGAGL